MAGLQETAELEAFETDDSTYTTSEWSSFLDDEAFATTPFGWMKCTLWTSIGASVSITQFNLDKHDILTRLGLQFPLVLRASWQYLSACWDQPRTCSVCRKRFFWMDGPLRDSRCWQCNRVFHDKCLWQQGIKPPPLKSRAARPWFHSAGCFKVDVLLRQSIVESPLRFKNGLGISYVLRGLEPTPQQLRKNLDAWGFFSSNFPEFPAHPTDPLLYVIMQAGRRAVSGAVVELFGQDLAHIKFVATEEELRGQGLYTQLHDLLEVWLQQLGVSKLAVSAFPTTEPLWSSLGFQPEAAATATQLQEWQEQLGCDLRMGTNAAVFVKDLQEPAAALRPDISAAVATPLSIETSIEGDAGGTASAPAS